MCYIKLMSSITNETVKRIASLVRIAIPDEELPKYGEHLSSLLTYVDQLQKIDTNDVEPLLQVNGLENIFRADVVTNGNMRDVLLACAPAQENGFIKVRTVRE